MHALTRKLKAAQAQYESESPYDDAQEDADEKRDEWIADHAPARAKALLSEPDFAWTAIGDLSRDVKCGFAEDLGRFFEAYHQAEHCVGEAHAGFSLYRTLKPYVEAAALEQATTEVAAQYDADMAQMERNAA